MRTTFTYSSRKFLKMLLLPVVLLLWSSLASGQALHQVEVSDFEFEPADLEINVGDTVEWVNIFGTHNVNGNQNFFPDNPESFGNLVGEDWTYRHVFTVPGMYDYRCDPHFTMGMVGTVTVADTVDIEEFYVLTVEFSGMSPHVGQDFYLAVTDSASGKEVGRVHTTAEVDFLVEVEGITANKVYHVDFWADHNSNGKYD